MTNHILTTPPVAQPALTLFFRSPARALLVLLLFPVIASAQGMLPGCQLVNGSLQCVPGLSTDPEQQIKNPAPGHQRRPGDRGWNRSTDESR